MDFRVNFKHMESSLSLYAYAEQKILLRLEKYDFDVAEAHVTFAVESGVNLVRCHLYLGGSGVTVTVDSGDDLSMYAAVDKLADKLDSRMRRHKDRVRSRRFRLPMDQFPEASARAMTTDDDSIDAREIISFERGRLAADG